MIIFFYVFSSWLLSLLFYSLVSEPTLNRVPSQNIFQLILLDAIPLVTRKDTQAMPAYGETLSHCDLMDASKPPLSQNHILLPSCFKHSYVWIEAAL